MGNIEVGKLDIYSAELRWDLIFNLDIYYDFQRACNIINKEKINANFTKDEVINEY
jgi:hypothetical protein